MGRSLHWDGCSNTRDLGGLRTLGGSTTAFGVVVRSDHPRKLSSTGWQALTAYGIRTIVSLTTEGYDRADQVVVDGPDTIRYLDVAIEDATDRAFMSRWADTGLWGTPSYWADALTRWPDRHAQAIETVATATGGVVIHCGRGHDRTGLIAALLLSLADVEPEEVAADYEMSHVNMPPDQQASLVALLKQLQTTSRAMVIDFLSGVDLRGHLRDGGLSDSSVELLRHRMLNVGRHRGSRSAISESRGRGSSIAALAVGSWGLG